MKTTTIVLTGAVLLLASAALAQERGTLKATYEGRALYVAHCAGCHGLDAHGTAWGTDGDSSRRTMPLWLRQLKQEWPAGDDVAQLKVAWLAQHLGAIQRTDVAAR